MIYICFSWSNFFCNRSKLYANCLYYWNVAYIITCRATALFTSKLNHKKNNVVHIMQELHTQAVIHIHTQTHVYPSPPFHAYKDLNLIHSISKKKWKKQKYYTAYVKGHSTPIKSVPITHPTRPLKYELMKIILEKSTKQLPFIILGDQTDLRPNREFRKGRQRERRVTAVARGSKEDEEGKGGGRGGQRSR